jgi:hypothetical protein
MLTPSQLNVPFQAQLGRDATPQEYESLKNSPLSSLSNLYQVPKYQPGTSTGTLSGIASKEGMSLDELLNLNPSYKSNPNLVKQGAILALGRSSEPNVPQTQQNAATGQISGNTGVPQTPPAVSATTTPSTTPTTTTASTSTTPPDPTQTALKNYQDIANQLSGIQNTIDSQLQTKLAEVQRSGGIVDMNQLKAEVAAANQPLLLQAKELSTQAKTAYQVYQDNVKSDNSQSSFLSKLGTTARSNLDKLMSEVASGNLDVSKLNPQDIATMEQEAGMPAGTLASITAKTAKKNWLVAPRAETTKSGNVVFVGVDENGKTITYQTGVTKKVTSPSSKIDKSTFQQYLANQGLPVSLATNTGTLSGSMLNQIVSAGVPLDVANGIWTDMVGEHSFDEIRKNLASQGFDPSLLDTFVQTLQGTNSSAAPSF